MNLEEFNDYLRNIPEKINEVAPTIGHWFSCLYLVNKKRNN